MWAFLTKPHPRPQGNLFFHRDIDISRAKEEISYTEKYIDKSIRVTSKDFWVPRLGPERRGENFFREKGDDDFYFEERGNKQIKPVIYTFYQLLV